MIMPEVDFRAYRLDKLTDMDHYMKGGNFDRFNAFRRVIDAKLAELPMGGVLRAVDVVRPDSYEVFTKVCCMHVWISENKVWHGWQDWKYRMLPDYSGITKVKAKK